MQASRPGTRNLEEPTSSAPRQIGVRETSPGCFFCVVGPSGAGKDSLIDASRTKLPAERFVYATRVITRAPGLPGEVYESCSEEEFFRRERAGEFLLTWQAHGLHYALPNTLLQAQHAGQHVIANGSRAVAAKLKDVVPNLIVIEITAPKAILAQRLRQRGRETEAEIEERLSRKVEPLPADLLLHTVNNDLTIDIGASRFISCVRTASGVEDERLAPIHRKVAGHALSAHEIKAAFDAINSDSVAQGDLEAFLIQYCQQLTDRELFDIAKIRCDFAPRLSWHETLVVDKHSLGGTPGSRVTMIVIPIVSAHGLLIPKTSTRAITSAAGTADAMEVLARVDLTHEEIHEVVARTRGCIAWNGKLNHTILDLAMNAMTRPYQLDTRRWAVASILSKKYTAGATHVLVDIPYGPSAKAHNLEQALELVDLFEKTGHALGITVKAFATPGDAPIGKGIGPALEARDVMEVLNNATSAPLDLREKALFFAGQIIAFDPKVGDFERGYRIAKEILETGQALRQMLKIMEHQGPPPHQNHMTPDVKTIVSSQSGIVRAIDGERISAIARTAGAPTDKWAGIDFHVRPGGFVQEGDKLYDVLGCSQARLDHALSMAHERNGINFHM